MKRLFIVFVAVCMNVVTAAHADTKPLEVEVLTTSQSSLFANISLIKGEKKAVLVDVPFTRADAHRVVAMILDSGKELETVIISHDHPDHFFAMEVVANAFPNAKIVAHPEVVKDIWRSIPLKVKRWVPVMGLNAPRTPTAPSPLDGDTILLEGHEIKVIGPMQGDHQHSTVIWVPVIKALMPGDMVHNKVFLWMSEHTPEQIAGWAAALEELAKLKPKMVVPGHAKPGLPYDTSGLDWSRRYLADWPKHVAASKDSKDLSARVKAAFPDAVDVLDDFLLGNSSRVAMKEAEPWNE